MIPTTHGILQQKQVAAATLSATPTSFQMSRLGTTCSGGTTTQTITVTASAGNSWTANVFSGDLWVMINGTVDGSASGTGNGSFTMDAGKYLSGAARNGSVKINSSAPAVMIAIVQDDCPG